MRYNIRLVCGEIKKVHAIPIRLRIAPDYKFILHREYYGRGRPPKAWKFVVTEWESGAMVAMAHSALRATREATRVLRKEGQERLQYAVDKWCNTHGTTNGRAA